MRTRLGSKRMVAALVVTAIGASALTAAVLAGGGDAGQTQPGSAAVSRVERSFDRPWASSCDGDACVIAILFQLPVRTPERPARVDVTLTVTLQYRTSPGTAARAGASIDDGTAPYTRMGPRSGFPLAPSRMPTTTTLTWVKRDLPASGRTYTFLMGVSPHSATGDDPFSVRGRKLTAVVETWSAGS
jgi:hypothetical protein